MKEEVFSDLPYQEAGRKVVRVSRLACWALLGLLWDLLGLSPAAAPHRGDPEGKVESQGQPRLFFFFFSL